VVVSPADPGSWSDSGSVDKSRFSFRPVDSGENPETSLLAVTFPFFETEIVTIYYKLESLQVAGN
jgi:hypothetical protein